MAFLNCEFKCNCTAAAVISSVIIGIIATFLQITAVITVTPAFLWTVFGIAVGFLGVLVISSVAARGTEKRCLCPAVNALLAGILGSVLFSVILLAAGIVATSVLSAILVGLLSLFFALTITSSACFVKCLTDCGD